MRYATVTGIIFEVKYCIIYYKLKLIIYRICIVIIHYYYKHIKHYSPSHRVLILFFFLFAVVKQKNVVLLSVDHRAAPEKFTDKSLTKVLSKHPIFIGGHPMLGRKLRGSTSQAQYVGCINNILINQKPIDIRPERAYGEVIAGVCPTI